MGWPQIQSLGFLQQQRHKMESTPGRQRLERCVYQPSNSWGWERPSSRDQPCQHLSCRRLASRTVGEDIPDALSHPVRGAVSRSPGISHRALLEEVSCREGPAAQEQLATPTSGRTRRGRKTVSQRHSGRKQHINQLFTAFPVEASTLTLHTVAGQ